MCEIIELFPKPKPERFCSFCKRKEGEVRKLFTNSVEGAGMRNICDSCVKLSMKRIQEQNNAAS